MVAFAENDYNYAIDIISTFMVYISYDAIYSYNNYIIYNYAFYNYMIIIITSHFYIIKQDF